MSKLTTELKVMFGRSSVERAIALNGLRRISHKERYEISEAARIMRNIANPVERVKYCQSLNPETKENLILSILNKVCT